MTTNRPSQPARIQLHSFRLVLTAGLAVTAGGIPSAAFAQSTVNIPLVGNAIPSSGQTAPDYVRTSTPSTISPAPGYTFSFNPLVRGTGLLGAILIGTTPRPLGDVFIQFEPGQYRLAFGAVRNSPPGGSSTIPLRVYSQSLGGTFSGLTINLTTQLEILSNGIAQGAIRNIVKPAGFGIEVTSGGAVITVNNTLPPRVISEWHFDGDLRSVRESGVAPASGPSKLRYLDDPAFGPILGGPGNEDNFPNPPTPTDITRQQSAFNTCAAFGIAPLGGRSDEVVYRTSPARNLADPTNRAKSRGLGLALWPNTRDTGATEWPDEKLGHWTMVWDLYIPSSAWNSEFPVVLIEDNHNNDAEADAFIRQVGGQGSVGYGVPFDNFVTTPLIQPNTWFRLALVSDGYRKGQGRLFINGTFIGLTDGDWVYNAVKSLDPRFGDTSSTQALGTPVPPASWNAWGQFPSPWVVASNANNRAPLASTICLFADLQGRGESVFVGNFLFADDILTDAEVLALGGPRAEGIFYPRPPACPADFNGDNTVDFFDYLDFVAAFASEDPSADFNGDNTIDFFDYLDFVAAFAGDC
jgi:hypothetical protein